MRVIALFSTSFFAKYLRVGEDGPGQGHLCHTDTFLVLKTFVGLIRSASHILTRMPLQDTFSACPHDFFVEK